ncbi:hypothetical protein CsNV_087 [Callinectes sapidus nudivirus]|nr:hypothetical protein CsNV_087 [Callinectes sapidus nudivirus]
MASILTAYFRKSYEDIENLDSILNTYNKISIHGDRLYDGYMHSIYIRVEEEECNKIFNMYNINQLLSDQQFTFFSNNKVGIIYYVARNPKIINSVEKWDFEHSTLYNYEDRDVIYCVDKFVDRAYVPPNLLSMVSTRLNSYGYWLVLDGTHTMFFGTRVMYAKDEINLFYINRKIRKLMNSTNIAVSAAATMTNPEIQLNVYIDHYVMFRCMSSYQTMYNKNKIKQLFDNQKLSYLLKRDPVNLLEAINP